METRDLLLEIPELTAIINHGGRPSVMTGELEPWASDMRAIATDTDAYCKVSGLVERAGQEWTTESVRPWVEALLEAFGPQRLIFASNWPVMTIMSSYIGWWEALNSILDTVGASSAERQALLGGTAAKIYGLAGNA
jgi:L-fuconolactonase